MSDFVELPIPRPGFGTDDPQVSRNASQVRCNVFRIGLIGNPKQLLYRYFVHITDARDRSPPVLVKKRVFKKLFDKLSGELNVFPVFDGDKLCFTHALLPTDVLSGTITASNPNVTHPQEEIFKYNLTAASEPLKLKDLSFLLLGAQHQTFQQLAPTQKQAALKSAKRLFQALNVATKYLMAAEEVQGVSSARAFFPQKAPMCPVSRGVVLRKGYIGHLRVGSNTSQKGAPDNLLFSVDSTCGAFIKSGNLVDICREIMGPKDLSSLGNSEATALHRILRRVRIEIRRGPDETIVRTIHRFGASSANEIFETEEGSISVQTYFKKHRGIDLQYPHYPTIQTSAQKKAVYPMELCKVLPNQQYRLKLDPDQQSAALTFQTSRPDARFQDITRGYSTMTTEQQGVLMQHYGLKQAQDYLVVPCRVLNPPALKYGRGTATARNGQWNIARPLQMLLRTVELKSWAFMICTQSLQERQVVEFGKGLLGKMNNIGMACPNSIPPPIIKLGGPSGSDIKKAFSGAIKGAYERFGQMPHIIICITDDKSPLYSMIKIEGDIVASNGVTTQCMIKKHISQLNDQYLTNLALKVNIKIGGINHSVRELAEICPGPTMFVGVDLSHQNFGPALKPSIVALVGSMDSTLSQYSGVLGAQPLLEPTSTDSRPRSQEPIPNFGDLLRPLLEQWRGKFPSIVFPKRLVIFRDGVSEGEFDQVLAQEYLGTKVALKEIGDLKNECKVTFVVCVKNHRIRFQAREAEQDKSGNAHAGTVVDREIGDPHLFDFFVQSQGGLKGTSRPCRYIVLKDESRFPVDKLQLLINSICSSYQPATRSVGMAAPAYYADILADRGRLWVNTDDDHSTVISSGSKPQTPEERASDLESCQNRITEMMANIAGVSHTMWWT